MSFFVNTLFNDAKNYLFGEEVVAERNSRVSLQDEYTQEIKPDTKLVLQKGSGPKQEITVKDYIGNQDKDSQFAGVGDPSTRLKKLLNNHQYRHASSDAKLDDQGNLVEPNGALVVPLPRPKVSNEVEWSKVRPGDGPLEADNGAMIVPFRQ